MDEQREDLLQETKEEVQSWPTRKRSKMSKVTYFVLIGIFAAAFVLSLRSFVTIRGL